MAGIRTENKIYEVGIYCRLSKDDGTDNESASIATQKSVVIRLMTREQMQHLRWLGLILKRLVWTQVLILFMRRLSF